MNGSDERDQSVERLLRQSFKAPRQGVTDSCLDAETLAAWVDGGLSGAALQLAESHVADCARCQSVVATLARTHTIVAQPEPLVSRRWLGWLVPLTAAAAAVALWVAVPRPPAAPAPQLTDQRQAVDEKAVETTSLDKLSQPLPAAKEEQAAGARENLASRERAAVPELREDAGRQEIDSLKDASPAAAAPPAALAAQKAVQAPSASGFADAVGIVIVSPDPAIRWRIVGSVVEHSTNGGSSWEAVFTVAESELTAGVAPSSSVCWVVGRRGVVLLSTDGRNFSRVPFPEMTDLSAVRATNAQLASVSTEDGRTFATTNAGATWTLH